MNNSEDDTFSALKYPPRHFRISYNFFNPLHEQALIERSVKAIIEGHGYVFTDDGSWKGYESENWLKTLEELKNLRRQVTLIQKSTPFIIRDANE